MAVCQSISFSGTASSPAWQLPLAAKVFVVLTTMLLPLGNEIFMNQTNIQWVMALIPVVLYCGTAPAAHGHRPSTT